MNNYKMVDIVKYIAAIMVICIHCNPITSQEPLNFFIKNIVCRIAVPFFFISSAYFVRKGSDHKEKYIKNYLKKLGKSYLAWSILFIYVGISWINEHLGYSGFLLIISFFFGLLQVGVYYHLWYIPAMIFSLFIVNKALKYISYKTVFLISILLFMFGSLETYYGFLPAGILKNTFDGIIQLIFTTRTGLLFGSIFVTIGFFIYDYQERLQSLLKFLPFLTILFSFLLMVEGFFLFNVERLDMNFLLMLIPFSFFFFLWILSSSIKIKIDTKKIRELSMYYYFVHPVCIILVEETGKGYQLSWLRSGVISFFLIVLFTHFLSLIIIEIRKKARSRKQIFLAGFLGIFVTFPVGILFFVNRVDNINVKYEMVPCLWFVFSFVVYYLLQKRKKIKAVN
ncbi:acyltransferase family protein [Enterococcus silesiacus]|uniref:acyltransferase family protein n=1 Tax=Enterococcus silesiacus TaxID=332949 RepID=UPI000A4B9311|nr:acyltransferase [Enterococcus silesiacus]